jgi:hypothetical protein
MSGISTKCSTGGKCLSVEYTDKVGELAKKHGLKLHIDGARIFNASVVSKSFSMCSVMSLYIVVWYVLYIHMEVGKYVPYSYDVLHISICRVYLPNRKIELQMKI